MEYVLDDCQWADCTLGWSRDSGLSLGGDQEFNALANSGSQVNTVTPNYMHCYDFPMLPLGNLMDHPLNLVGLGRTQMHLLSFMILRAQVKEIMGHNEDVVFLVMPDKSEFAWCLPIMIGTCTLGRIVNVIKESEMDQLSMLWAVASIQSVVLVEQHYRRLRSSRR